ncbi:MAG TPA: hypothetical protein VMG12_19970 [Polyangiaceae bacterium]|nr:hypothetical protein [Polyangiaceae bacterium]
MEKSTKQWLGGLGIAAIVGAFAPTSLAAFCYGADLGSWAAESHCAGSVDTNKGYAKGGGTAGTSTAFMQANLSFSQAGGVTDQAIGYGWRSGGGIAGTPQCYGGPGGSATLNAPGCVTCSVTDLNSGSGTVASGPAGGACTTAATHQVFIAW